MVFVSLSQTLGYPIGFTPCPSIRP